MADTKFGEIAVYEDDDGKAVWEFEGKVQSDIPLDTDAQDFAGAINELKKLSEAEGGDDWQPPDWWIPVPEPDEYDIYILVNVFTENSGLSLILTDTNFSGGNGSIVCDWGDGTKETLAGISRISHEYSNSGQFLVHIVCSDKNNFISSLSESPYGAYYLIVKTGNQIFWAYKNRCTYTDTAMLNSLKSLTILNDNSIKAPETSSGSETVVSFRYMHSLQRLDCPTIFVTNLNANGGFLGGGSNVVSNIKNIFKSIDLSKCTSIKKISVFDSGQGLAYNPVLTELELPNCEYIDSQMFSDCLSLRKITAPKCTYVGTYAFKNCYSLEEIQFADDCTFGTNCFQNCYSLYPRPDGSVI